MAGLGGMQEEGRRAGAGQRGGDLVAHEAGLAQAADDHPAARREAQLAGPHEGGVNAWQQLGHGPGLDLQGTPAGGNQCRVGHLLRLIIA